MLRGAKAARQTFHSNGRVANANGTVSETQSEMAEGKKEHYATYDSMSESSVSRLLATLFASPRESSLWYG
jgi:hypothetical protein